MNQILKAVQAAEALQSIRCAHSFGWPHRVNPKPLAFHYARSEEFEVRRRKFYDMVERIYGQSINPYPKPFVSQFSERENKHGGREGRPIDWRVSRDSVVISDHNAAPFEWLMFSGKFEDNRYEEEAVAAEIANFRWYAGLEFRKDMEKAQITLLRSPELDGVPNSGSGPRPIADVKLTAMMSLDRLQSSMSSYLYKILDDVVWLDKWLFRSPDKVQVIKVDEKAQRKVRASVDRTVLEKTLRALDHAAVHYNYLSFESLFSRWYR
ncbi:hypothetical protein TRICHSKD4_3695 [Roseibium sp. TrichSKD4]|uniref:hypothetical protein n=1 Tax=Roseibium sp. TrichSKD4 TaxID=744980 RepID=UPI0001E56B4D|nr:hypothetical protein [Roseibium sp. TrichSKD4]EFO30121.1 hypothetical protein TRICHSKD4_3695 [Roseibium sp. TrichSKD4]